MKRLTSLLLFIFLAFFSASVLANSGVVDFFDKKVNKINSFLTNNHQKARQNPEKIIQFVDSELLEVWSARNTMRALLGPSRWKQLSQDEVLELTRAYEQTIRRYLFELLDQYDQQVATVKDVRLNDRGNKGWLRVNIESPSLPTLPVDLKIYNENEQWTIYDFSFQGISFVNMKRSLFRSTFDSKGAAGVVRSLNEKNQEFNQTVATIGNE
ncbi:ABC transporter substrate-binding protein [Kangiella marina]|uniref:Toluene tolerance protein n=1 Tax=Kangiella marina TaxID=1079178 RepID=A0ABP8INX0_9GAMM